MVQHPSFLIDAVVAITDADTAKRIFDLADTLAQGQKDYFDGLMRDKSPKLMRNRIQCLLCEDIIESTYRHDFKYCKCGVTFVDGGLSYCRYGSERLDNVKDLCEYENEKVNPITSSLTNAQYDQVMKVGKKK